MHWVLPALSSAVSCMAFHPASANSLLFTLSKDNSFLIFDVQDKSLSPWCRENADVVPQWSQCLSRATVGPVYNVSFDPSSKTSFVLYGQAFSVCIDLDERIPTDRGPSADSPAEGNMCVPVSVDSNMMDMQHPASTVRWPLNRRDNKKRKEAEKRGEESSASSGADANGRAAKVSRPSRNYKVIKMRSVVQLSMVGRQEMVSAVIDIYVFT